MPIYREIFWNAERSLYFYSCAEASSWPRLKTPARNQQECVLVLAEAVEFCSGSHPRCFLTAGPGDTFFSFPALS